MAPGRDIVTSSADVDDPNDADGYVVASGCSFATPLVAGADRWQE